GPTEKAGQRVDSGSEAEHFQGRATQGQPYDPSRLPPLEYLKDHDAKDQDSQEMDGRVGIADSHQVELTGDFHEGIVEELRAGSVLSRGGADVRDVSFVDGLERAQVDLLVIIDHAVGLLQMPGGSGIEP